MPAYDIFISYSRADTERVRQLVEVLRRENYKVFFDQKEILIGEDWKRRLSDSVASARCLVLCWSAASAASPYVHYELFRAEGFGKLVLPWLLDATPLPELVSIQGSKLEDPEALFLGLRRQLGMRLRSRRRLYLAAVCLVALLAAVVWHVTHRPWQLGGIVRDVATESPIAGVTVEAIGPGGHTYKAVTSPDGRYDFTLPLPRQSSIELLFHMDGYDSDHPLHVTTEHNYTEYLKALPAH